MKNKLIKLCIFTIFILFNLQTQNVNASIIKHSMSKEGIETYYVTTEDEFSTVLNIAKASMMPSIYIICSGEMADISDNIDIREFYTNKTLKHYLSYQDNIAINVNKIGVSSGFFIKSISNKKNTVSLLYKFYYYDTLEQSNYINDKMNKAIIDNLDNLKTDYQKAYWAYKWIIENTNIDFEENNFSAYSGFTDVGTVCSGYATLYSALTNKLGLNCRYIEGSVYNSKINNHAWNIIELNNEWYCVDAIWGDHYDVNKYFLKTKKEFSSSDYGYHNSNLYDEYIEDGEVFATDIFNNLTNIESSFVLPSVYNVELDVLKKNVLLIGESYNYLISNPNQVDLVFISNNSNIVSVNKNGVIIGISIGTATITVYNEELKIRQTCEITVM